MNTRNQAVMPKRNDNTPLFASPWMALFVLLRQEFTQARNAK